MRFLTACMSKKGLRPTVVSAIAGAVLVALVVVGAGAATPVSVSFSNGFETDTSGWFSGGGNGTLTREPSGYVNGGYASGIASATASNYHARAGSTDCANDFGPGTDCSGPYTLWGTSGNMPFPASGYQTSVDIYLDVAWAAAHPDVRFDWDSAIDQSDGSFLSDFVFNAGTTPSSYSGTKGFVINASTNADRSGAFPSNTCPSPSTAPNSCRAPVYITTSGWYTFQHSFTSVGGVLAVTMTILNSSGGTVASWTIYSAPIQNVGSTAYGWFPNEEIGDLPIDNSSYGTYVASTRYVATTGSDVSNVCTTKWHPCLTIQHAVDSSLPGDTISIAAGTYTGQVTIGKSLTIAGPKGGTATIAAPASMTPDADGKLNVVEIGSGATVSATDLTVTGPSGTSCGTIDSGIAVIGGASLTLDHGTVSNIGPSPLNGCQNGEGIRAGTQHESSDAQVGHIDIEQSTVTGYNKNGIAVAGAGSSGQVNYTTVSTSNAGIASNGIEVASGATLTANHDTVSGNECNVGGGVCGPNLQTETQATGFLIFGAGSGVQLTNNTVTGNDIGVYTDTGITMSQNTINQNRDEGLVVDSTATGFSSTSDKTWNDGNYGVYVGSTSGGTFGGSASFSHVNSSGNAVDDLFWDGHGTFSATSSTCATASPSRAAWHC